MHFWTVSCYRRLSFLWHDALKQAIVEGFRLLQREFKICMIAYVVMPDHIHYILYPHPKGSDTPVPISLLHHRFKKFIGLETKERLREIWRKNGRLWAEPLNRWWISQATGHEHPRL